MELVSSAAASAHGLAFSISPAKKQREHNDEEDYYLTLAPFSRAPKINFGEVKINTLVERTLHIFNPQQFEIKLNVTNQDLCINNMEISIDEKSSVDFKIRWQPDKADYYKYSIFFEVVNGARLKFLVHAFGICVAPPPKPTTRKPFNMLQPIKKEKSTSSSGPVLQPVGSNQIKELKKTAPSTKSVVTTLKTTQPATKTAAAPALEKKPFLKAKNKENVAEKPGPSVTTSTSVNHTTIVASVTKPSKYTYGTTRAHTILSSTVTKTKKHRVPIDFYESYTGEDDDEMTEQESEEAIRRKTCVITTPKVLKMIVEDPAVMDEDMSDNHFQFNSTKALRRSISVGNLGEGASPFADATVIMAAGSGRGSEFGSRSVSSSTSNINDDECESPTVSSTLKKPMSASNPHIAKFMSSNRNEFVAYLEPLDDTPTLLSKEKDRNATATDLTPKLCDFTAKSNKSQAHSATIATTQLIDISACSSHITNSTLLYGSTTPRAHQAAARNMRLSGFNSTALDPSSCYRLAETSNILNFEAGETSAVNISDAKEGISNVTVIVNNRTKDLTETDDDPPRYFNYDANHPSLIRSVLACQRAWRLKRERKEQERLSRLNLALKSIDELKSTIMSMDTIAESGEVKASSSEGIVMNHVERLKREREHMVRCLVSCQRWLRMKRFRRALQALKQEEQMRKEHEHLVSCAVSCQRAVRMKRFRSRLSVLKHERALELERIRVETVNKYAVICQRAVRIKNFRKAVSAIKQENERKRLEIEEHQRQVLKFTVICQRAIRMKKFRKSLTSLKHQRDLEIAYQASLLNSALMVQRAFRMRSFRRNLARLREEKRVRDEQERQRLMNHSACTIQRQWHLYKFRCAMKRYRTAAITIQTWFRDDMKERLAYIKLKRTVIRLQQLSRIYLAKRQASALKIQSYWRMHVERIKYQKALKATVAIQRWYRSKEDRLNYIKLKRVTLCMQARARFVIAKRHKMATRIQRAYRLHRFRQAMDKYRNAAVIIQRWTRSMALRYEHIKKLRIIFKIQRLYRHVYMVRRQSAALKIQRAWRCAKARRELEILRAQEQENRYVNKCATRIQALWRGYWVRKQTDHVLNSIRCRLSIYMPSNLPGSAASPVNTLGARIRQSLIILSCYQEVPIQQMIFALTDLDKVTKLSPECCTTFIQEGAVNILYSFISNCNRSIPHMDLIRYCLQIFINLAKYTKTVEYVLCPSNLALTTLTNLFQYYHISNPIIFMEVCILFILIAQSDRMIADLNEQPGFISKLLSLHSIIERKTSYTMKRYPNVPVPLPSSQTGRNRLAHQNSNPNPNESTLSNISMASLPNSISNSSISSIASNINSSSAASSSTYAISNSTCFGSASKMASANTNGRKVVVTLEPDWVLGTKKTTIELVGQLGALEYLLNTLGVKYNNTSVLNPVTFNSGVKTPRKSVSMNSIGETAASSANSDQKKVSRKIIK